MARILPTPADLQIPEPARMTPRAKVRAGSGAADGHWRDVAGTSNTILATHAAGVQISQGWGDGQFVTTEVGYVERLRYRIPKVSSVHLAEDCWVHASAAAAGNVRFTCVANANTAVIAVPAAAAAFYSSAAPLDLTGGFVVDADGDYAEIVVEVQGTTIDILDLWTEALDYDPSGNYPGATGTLGGVVVDGAVVLDDDELDADEPLSSRLAHAVRSNVDAFADRRRVYLTWSGIIGTSAPSQHAWMTEYPHRITVPVIAGTRARGHKVIVWLHTRNTSLFDFHVYLQHGPDTRVAGKGPLNRVAVGLPAAHVTTILVPASDGEKWTGVLVELPEIRDQAPDVPQVYPGVVVLGLHSDPPDATRGLLGVCAWGR